MPQLRVDIWSDIACPWCYVGKRRIEAALKQFEHRDDVNIVWRSFELDPSAPPIRDPSVSFVARLARKYRSTEAEAEATLKRMTDAAAEDGLSLRFDQIRPGNTFDAHRLLHLALERGRQDPLKERLLLAYFTEGELMGEQSTLVRMGTEAGLDEAEARGVLDGDAYGQQVRDDQAEARERGINGVPFYLVADRIGVSGAQSPESLCHVLRQAWAHLSKSANSAAATEAAEQRG